MHLLPGTRAFVQGRPRRQVNLLQQAVIAGLLFPGCRAAGLMFATPLGGPCLLSPTGQAWWQCPALSAAAPVQD